MMGSQKTNKIPGDNSPQALFASLGFGFVHWFLWLVLAGCSLLLAVGVALGWFLQGEVAVQATGAVRPTTRHLVKSGVDGRVAEVRVRAGDQVQEKDILFMLSPREIRGRLSQIDRELDLSDTRRARLRDQIDHDRLVLTAVMASRLLAVERAAYALQHVRREQQLYTDYARGRWSRSKLEDLVPVRESMGTLDQAQADLRVTERQLGAKKGATHRSAIRGANLAATRCAVPQSLAAVGEHGDSSASG